MSITGTAANTITATRFRANWIGLFTGENQTKALQRALANANADGSSCCGLALDEWNFFVFLWWRFVAIATLGFLVKVPNVLVVTESTGESISNRVVATRYRAGWPGLFTGENQTKALRRVLTEINDQGLGCCGVVRDMWNPFVRLFWILVALLTLGFFVRVPNLLVVTKEQ